MNIEELLWLVNVRHVILRKREYKLGDDVDVLCEDVFTATQQIISQARGYYDMGYTVSVRQQGEHCHIDFLKENILQYRIDLISSLDVYKSEVYANEVAADMAMRLLEYAKAPHKVQHLQYVKEKIANL